MKERKTSKAEDKRSLLIGAILNNDKGKLQQLSGADGKRVVVLDTFLDFLIHGSSGDFDDSSIQFVATERYKKMWEDIERNTTDRASL